MELERLHQVEDDVLYGGLITREDGTSYWTVADSADGSFNRVEASSTLHTLESTVEYFKSIESREYRLARMEKMRKQAEELGLKWEYN